MASIFKHYLYRAAELAYKKTHRICVFETNKGLKNINMGSVAQHDNYTILNEVTLDASELYLGPDYLNDRYSLIGIRLSDSPHYGFMKALDEGTNLKETDYVKRWLNGTLDWRRPMPLKMCVSRWQRTFQEMVSLIENGTYLPVLVYQAEGRYYMYDGKHRAALCAYKNKPVKCSVISNSCIFDYYARYLLEIASQKAGYEKHRNFYRARKSQCVGEEEE